MSVWRHARPLAAALLVTVAGCGDPESNDNRGYTKAPLEKPEVLIGGEEPGEMSRYGSPNQLAVEVLELPEPTESTGAQQEEDAHPVALPEGVTQDMVAAGEQLFGGAGVCFACHGAGGAGGPLAPALNDAEWLNIEGSYDEIVATVTTGVPQPKQFAAPMPPRGGSQITDEQVRQVAAYVYSISR